MKQKICLKKLRGLCVAPRGAPTNEQNLVSTFMASMMSLGYVMTKDLYEALRSLPRQELVDLHHAAIAVLSEMKGAHVQHRPMYPNFPSQVMAMNDLELYWNAIVHYWTAGEWKPETYKLPRQFAFENIKFKPLKAVSEADYLAVFTALVSSKDSLSDEDKGFIEHFLDHEKGIQIPETIGYKETMCVVAGHLFKQGHDVSSHLKTATDVLRFATYLSGGDVSLTENTKFASMPRSKRKVLAQILDKVCTEEDLVRHRSKWVRLFHMLHIGDYSDRVFQMAKKIRNNEHIETFASRLHESIGKKQASNAVAVDTVLQQIVQRPGEFSRRLDHLLRLFNNPLEQATIAAKFKEVGANVPTRILSQLLGHFNTRTAKDVSRVVFPKGKTQKAQIIPSLDVLPREAVTSVINSIESTLLQRFSKLSPLGKVWIDPELIDCPLPTQQRSASAGNFAVARGTRFPFGDETKDTLRFFIYWVGQDIDLSATLHNEQFELIEQVSYTNLRSTGFQAHHSGDITRAPDGASEFIDITITPALEKRARYVVMNVFLFNGGHYGDTFAEHDTCFAGWMTRQHPNSNEIFDPKTVEGKIDVKSATKGTIPVIFDLKDRKVIWCDLEIKDRSGLAIQRRSRHRGGNNVESNGASIGQTLQAMLSLQNKMSLYHLFQLHGQARGQLVDKKEDAQTIFSIREGITPFDVLKINSEFMV